MGVASEDKNTSAILFDAKTKLVDCKRVVFSTQWIIKNDGEACSSLMATDWFPFELQIL